MCPLDVVSDTLVSLCEDSHSLSFAVPLYMLSIEIAVLPPKMDVSEIVVCQAPLLTSPGFLLF